MFVCVIDYGDNIFPGGGGIVYADTVKVSPSDLIATSGDDGFKDEDSIGQESNILNDDKSLLYKTVTPSDAVPGDYHDPKGDKPNDSAHAENEFFSDTFSNESDIFTEDSSDELGQPEDGTFSGSFSDISDIPTEFEHNEPSQDEVSTPSDAVKGKPEKLPKPQR